MAAQNKVNWKGLYLVGGISAFLYIILSIIIPGIMLIGKSYELINDIPNAKELLEFVYNNKIWWITLQALVLGSSIFAILVFTTLYPALKNTDKSNAATGAVIGVVSQALFLAYFPVLIGLAILSQYYPMATGSQASAIEGAALALIAINNAFNPVYESIYSIGIIFVSVAMLKGVFHKSVGFTGLITGAAGIVCISLYKVIGLAYLWWWIPFVVWFVMIGVKLIKMGMNKEEVLQ